MRIERTMDVDLVDRIIRHPKIYPHVTEDDAPPAERFTVRGLERAPGVYFLTPIAEEGVAGVFMVHLRTTSIYEVHTCILPAFWGRSLDAAKLLIDWVFANTQCRKLITLVPANNRLARKLALDAGMEEQGCITGSYLKAGVLLDQFILGIGRRQPCQ